MHTIASAPSAIRARTRSSSSGCEEPTTATRSPCTWFGTSSLTGTEGAVHTIASAPSAIRARTRSSSSGCEEPTTATRSPCTWFGTSSLPMSTSTAGRPGHAPPLRAANALRRFSSTAAGSSPTCEPRLSEAYGATDTPPTRSVNPKRTAPSRPPMIATPSNSARSMPTPPSITRKTAPSKGGPRSRQASTALGTEAENKRGPVLAKQAPGPSAETATSR